MTIDKLAGDTTQTLDKNKILQQALTILLRKLAEDPNWRLHEEGPEGYVTTMALRLANACKSVAATERRHPR